MSSQALGFRDLAQLLRETVDEWTEDRAPQLAAALAYYMAFSLAPLMVIAIAGAGLVFGQDAAQHRVFAQISELLGDEGARQIQEMIVAAGRTSAGIVATVVGGVTLLLGASGVFGQLQDALNAIWEVQPRPGRGVLGAIRQRFFSFTMVLGSAFLLLVSLVVGAVIAGLGERLLHGREGVELLLQVFNAVVGLGVATVLFGLIFKVVPDVEVRWRDVWVGAFFTAALFSIGRLALGWYLGRGSFGSSFGAAGSLVIVLFWIYYSAQILFFGAEFTQVYASRYGARIRPSPGARSVHEAQAQRESLEESRHWRRQAEASAREVEDLKARLARLG